jgi:hypothetical protein
MQSHFKHFWFGPWHRPPREHTKPIAQSGGCSAQWWLLPRSLCTPARYQAHHSEITPSFHVPLCHLTADPAAAGLHSPHHACRWSTDPRCSLIQRAITGDRPHQHAAARRRCAPAAPALCSRGGRWTRKGDGSRVPMGKLGWVARAAARVPHY